MADRILTIENLCLSYGNQPVVTDARFHADRGDFIAIVGPNGSGKSTLIRGIVGLHKPESGEIRWDGDRKNPPVIGYLPQKTMAADDLFPASVYEIVSTGLFAEKKGMRLLSGYDRAYIRTALERLGIAHLAHKRIGRLSGGQQQRVLLARALAGNPVMLILDEPTSALDPAFRADFYKILGELNARNGITILLVSHDTGSVAQYTKKMIYLDRKIIFFGTYDDFCSSEAMTGYFGSSTQHQMCGRHGHGDSSQDDY